MHPEETPPEDRPARGFDRMRPPPVRRRQWILPAVALVVALAAVPVLLVPRLLDEGALRARAEGFVGRRLGAALAIEGGAALAFRPDPKLVLDDVRVRYPSRTLRAARVEADLAVLPLLIGRLQPEALRLVGARVDLAEASAWRGLPPENALPDLVIEDGGLTLGGLPDGKLRLSNVAGTIAATPTGQTAFDFAGAANGLPFAWQGRTGRTGDGRGAIETQASFSPDGGGAFVDWQGRFGPDAAYRGRLNFGAENLRALAPLLRPLGVAPPAWRDAGFEAEIENDAATFTVEKARVALAGQTVEAGLEVDRQARRFRLTVAGGALRLTPGAWADFGGFLDRLPDFAGEAAARIDTLTLAGFPLRGVALALDRPADGGVRLRSARATLPGGEASLSGSFLIGETTGFKGRLAARSRDLRGLSDHLPTGLAKAFAAFEAGLVETAVAADAEGLRFTDVRLALDDTRFEGGAALTPDAVAVEGRARRIETGRGPGGALALVRDALDGRRLALDLRVDRWRGFGIGADDVRAVAGYDRDGLALKSLSADLGGGRLDAAGRLDPDGRPRTLDATLADAAPARLLRALDITPGPGAERLEPIEARLRLEGRGDGTGGRLTAPLPLNTAATLVAAMIGPQERPLAALAGRWPETALPFAGLQGSTFDLDLDLGDTGRLRARRDDAAVILTTPGVALFDGTIKGHARLEAEGAAASLQSRFAVQGADAAAALASLGVTADPAGTFDLAGAVSAYGKSAADFARTLDAKTLLTLDAANGRLAGRVAGENGIVRGTLRRDGEPSPMRVTLKADLLAWLAELRVQTTDRDGTPLPGRYGLGPIDDLTLKRTPPPGLEGFDPVAVP